METSEETSNNDMSAVAAPSSKRIRLCLVGDVVNNSHCVEVAQMFGVPVITSETGLDLINDQEWQTYFVLEDFESSTYDAIYENKNKHCFILGPPALKDGLIRYSRPVYNLSMRGAIACFKDIRDWDLLKKLVLLIHSMGGSIRKHANLNITHLICIQVGGPKYHYAKTFDVTVVTPDWVYAAWERRNEIDFQATSDDFTKDYMLKAFQGLNICFVGFPTDEHEHMIDVLKSNGGIPCEINDPACTHVVICDDYCTEPRNTSILKNSNIDINRKLNNRNSNVKDNYNSNNKSTNDNQTEVDNDVMDIVDLTNRNKKDNNKTDVIDNNDNDNNNNYDQQLVVRRDNKSPLINQLNYTNEGNTNNNNNNNCSINDVNGEHLNLSFPMEPIHKAIDSSTPKQSKVHKNINLLENFIEQSEEPESWREFNNMPNLNNIFDIEAKTSTDVTNTNIDNSVIKTNLNVLNNMKRKHENVDTCSLMSIDSCILPSSEKKPKLFRTGSLTRSVKRSINFITERIPKSNTFIRRNSVAVDDFTPQQMDNFDDSLYSINSTEISTNQSIGNQFKDTMRTFGRRLIRYDSFKNTINSENCTEHEEEFKTPKAPFKSIVARTLSATKKTLSHSNFNLRRQSLDICAQNSYTDRNFTVNNNSIMTNMTTSTSCKNIRNSENCTEQKEEFKTPKAPFKNIMGRVLSTSTATLSAARIRSRRQSMDISDESSFRAIFNQNFTDTKNCTITTAITATTISTVTISTASTTAVISTTNLMSNHHQINETKLDHYSGSLNQDPMCSSKLTSCDEILKSDVDSKGHSNMVVDEHAVSAKPEINTPNAYIVKSDWFWYTIQNGYANELDFLYSSYVDNMANTPNNDKYDALPISLNKRKRKRFSQRLLLEGKNVQLSSGKRKSSISDAGRLSMSGSFFDCTTSPDKLENGALDAEPDALICEQTSMRFNHFRDFYTTESNYVGILDTIVNLFQKPLEEMADNNNALINKSEIKEIFGNFLPIHEVHQHMLEKLRTLHNNWVEDCLIGDIILQHRDDLIKAYPPYVNFFEKMKETLVQCDTQNPRFHAFLKINQTKPECGRHSLQDLMIRPVQRLPSISLLLNSILKHTNENNPDHHRLEEALKAITEVMTHINEDKRRNQSRMAMFNIFNDIENCPPHLISSNRDFISRCEVNELSNSLSGRGDTLILYLFSDTLEVCKKRSRAFNSTKSPSSAKCYKHIDLISLNAIRFVIDITDSPRAFAILCRQEKDELYSFNIVEEIDKMFYLKTLCKQMAENACRTDTDKALVYRTSQELEVDISNVNLSTLSKAFKLAARTRFKVGRAFSFNKTPSKLKRTVSTMMTSPFGSTNSLTPATQLEKMRLSSCTNIHEAAQEDDCNGIQNKSPLIESQQRLPPSSVQPTRKCKNSTVNTVGRM